MMMINLWLVHDFHAIIIIIINIIIMFIGMVESVTNSLSQICCWVCFEISFEIGRHLEKLWVKKLDCLNHSAHQSTFLLKDKELAWNLEMQCKAASVNRNCWGSIMVQLHQWSRLRDRQVSKWCIFTDCDSPTDANSNCLNVDRVCGRGGSKSRGHGPPQSEVWPPTARL